MVACGQKFLCRAPQGCALRESTTLGDQVQPSNVSGRGGKGANVQLHWMGLGGFQCKEKQLGFPEGSVMWEFHFCPCSSPSVGVIGACGFGWGELEPLCSLPSLLAGPVSLCSSQSVSSSPAITATEIKSGKMTME